jgi:hypothetical protein
MPKLNPGINPSIGSGRRCVFFLTSVFFPFLLLAQPVITSIAPLSGPIGTTVTITGNNFGATPGGNVVYFGTAKAAVTAAGATTLTVTVPPGASYELLTVATGGKVAYSSRPFNVTFSDPGQFTPTTFNTQAPTATGGTRPAAVCAKDLDGDGKIDIAVINDQGLTVFNNSGTVGFPHFDALAPYGTSTAPAALAAGDVDGDGRPDLVISSQTDPFFYIYLNTGTTGNISFATPFPVSSSTNIVGLAIADINGDGLPDIVTGSAGDGSVSVYNNSSSAGNLSFPSKTDLALSPGSSPGMLVATDLDGDGMLDIVCTDLNNSLVSPFLNTGARGGVISMLPIPGISTGDVDQNTGFPPYPFGLAAGDMDGDGRTDLVVLNQFQSRMLLLRNTGSTGTISFHVEPDTLATLDFPNNLVINDLDGDGLPDVSMVSLAGDSVRVYRNTSTSGHIVLAESVSYIANAQAYWLAAGDMDNDGLPDLSVVNNGAATFSVLINKKADGLTVTSFTPTAASTGTVVTITGNYLAGATGVSFGGAPASSFTVVSPTTITATVGAGASGPVTVTTPIAYAYKDGFTYNLQPQTITTFSPQTALTGTPVTIAGTGFISNSINAVSFGGTPAQSFTVISDTEISAVVGTGATGDVKVMSLTDTAVAHGFTYAAAPPTGPPDITSFSPMSGISNTDITINGANLLNITSVSFGGTQALSFRVISDNVVHATVAAGATGDVSVTSSNGTGSYPGFTFLTAPPPQSPPKLTGFSPKSATTGATVTIKGTHLSAVTAITFGNSLAVSFSAPSDSVIVAVVGTGATGYVKAASPVGADSLTGFTYVQDTIPTNPVAVFQLVQFSGAVAGNQGHLNWQTRNDAGISYYAIERGIDGNQFTVIGTIGVNSKTGVNHNYSFTDFNPKNGLNYYRIKMQDTTTHYTYSGTISLQLAGSTPMLAIYPNPVKYGFFLVDLPAAANASVFRLADLSGRILKMQAVNAGVSQVRIDVPGLPRGTYRLHWTDGTRTAYQSILVL